MSSTKEKGAKPKQSKPKAAPQPEVKLKVVIRRLPPHLPESIFWDSVSSWVTDETCTWKVFYQGKPKKRDYQEVVPSRAYVAFKTPDQLVSFSKGYDGHLFRDKQGNESFAVVEFAPFQKSPSEKKKQDTRAGTIEEDPDYQSFIASLEAPVEPAGPPETSKQVQEQPTTTPLLASLLAEKSANKDKESILRYHGHYRALDALPKKRDVDDEREFSRSLQRISEAEQSETQASKSGASSSAQNNSGTEPYASSSKKPRHQKPGPPPPTSPSRPQKNKGPAEKSGAPTSGPSPKKRPTFKFDAALAGVRPKASDPPAPAARIDDDPAPAAVESGTSIEPGTGQSRRAKQRQKQKELRKLEQGNAVPQESAGSTPSTPRTGAAVGNAHSRASEPKINSAPSTARIDDVPDSNSASRPAAAGIIAIPSGIERGRGRGAGRGDSRGRGGARGRGRGRGNTSAPTPAPATQIL